MICLLLREFWHRGCKTNGSIIRMKNPYSNRYQHWELSSRIYMICIAVGTFERTAWSYVHPFPTVVSGLTDRDRREHNRWNRTPAGTSNIIAVTAVGSPQPHRPARHHKSRVAAGRFWFRQLTPPADNFRRHMRSCRRDLALHFLLPPDDCGASRHTAS